MAANIPPVRITHADLAHAADARAGLATAAFTPNPSDPTFTLLTITYADGARARLGIQNMIAMGGPSVWRLVIGADAHPGPPGPSPAEMSPSAGEVEHSQELGDLVNSGEGSAALVQVGLLA